MYKKNKNININKKNIYDMLSIYGFGGSSSNRTKRSVVSKYINRYHGFKFNYDENVPLQIETVI